MYSRLQIINYFIKSVLNEFLKSIVIATKR